MPPRNLAVRIRCPYETLRTTMGDWGLVSKHVVAYEHPEDLTNIHCHLLLTNVYVTNQNLKDTMWAHGVPCKGSGQISFKTTFKCPTTKKVMDITDETWPKYISYMSKGKHEPKYAQGFSDETIQSYRALWVNYTKDPPAYLVYLEFKKYIEQRIDKPRLIDWGFVVSCAHVFCMNKHKAHTPTMRKEQSQLIDDYCYWTNISKIYNLPYQQQPK